MNAGLVMTRDLTPAVWGTTASRTRVLVVALIALGAVPALAAAQTTTQVVEYYTTDAIGSVRAVTKQVNGQWQVVARHDFMPFGEEVAPPVPPQDKRLFTGKERDSETGQDYFEARYYGGARGRFSSVDPIDAVTGSDDREQFEAYLSNPQSWNRYAYVWSNPLRYLDPLGQKVYLVTYTTGNTRGDDEFRRAAETRAAEIEKQKGFDPAKDTVLLRGVQTKADFGSALKDANALGEKFGQVGEVSLLSHSGSAGPVFHNDKGEPTAFTGSELGQLKVNWESDASARFYGCNTGLTFAQGFADSQGVATYGYNGYAYFSSRPDLRTDPQPQGPLYLIHAAGWSNNGPWGVILRLSRNATAIPMVRRTPARR